MSDLASPTAIDSFSAFLKYGPTGLAGLMLLLVVVVLFAKNFDDRRERTLKLFMYVGALCFTLSLAANFFSREASYKLHFRVVPLDTGSKRVLPLPIIKANNHLLGPEMEFAVNSEVTAIVDVTDAIDFTKELRAQNANQREALNQIVGESGPVMSELQRVVQVIDKNCSGGPSGVPASSNPRVIAITSKAASSVAAFKASAAAVLTAPEPKF